MDIWFKTYFIGIPISVLVCGIVWFIYCKRECRNASYTDPDMFVTCAGLCIIWPLSLALSIVVGLFALLFHLGVALADFVYSKITKGGSRWDD